MPVLTAADLQAEIDNRKRSLREDIQNFIGSSQSRGFISTLSEVGPILTIRMRHSAEEEPAEMAADQTVTAATAAVTKQRDDANAALEAARAENTSLNEEIEALNGQVAELTATVATLQKAPTPPDKG